MIDCMASIEGPSLVLRLITPDDAAYVHSLRMDPTYNTHLSEVRGTVDDQRAWIESYKMREAQGQEFYYIVMRKDGTRCGTVRLYEITPAHFTWGSWILDYNKPPKAALESVLLSFGHGFDSLDIAKAHIDVRRNNMRAIAFYRRFGMIEAHTDALNIYFSYPRNRFRADRSAHLALLRAAAEETP